MAPTGQRRHANPMTTAPRVRWRVLAQPEEHGAWGLWLEPALLGLLLAPSLAGGLLATAGLAALLAQQPLGVALADRRRARRYPRTRAAEGLALAFAGLAFAFVVATFASTPQADWAWPLMIALPLAALQLADDSAWRGRTLRPQLAGAAAIAALAPMVALAGGAPPGLAWGVGAALAARNVSSVAYLRARLRRQRGLPAPLSAAAATNILAPLVALALAASGTIPAGSLLGFSVLALRAVWGLRAGAPAARPMHLGIAEMAYGLALVALIAWRAT